jgi:hypothetical protein
VKTHQTSARHAALSAKFPPDRPRLMSRAERRARLDRNTMRAAFLLAALFAAGIFWPGVRWFLR